MPTATRNVAHALIALLLWLPAAQAWASCCALALPASVQARTAQATPHSAPQARKNSAPCHGDASGTAAQGSVGPAQPALAETPVPQGENPPPADGMPHADGSVCAHGAGCTPATAVVSLRATPFATQRPAGRPAAAPARALPDAPIFGIDHPPSLI